MGRARALIAAAALSACGSSGTGAAPPDARPEAIDARPQATDALDETDAPAAPDARRPDAADPADVRVVDATHDALAGPVDARVLAPDAAPPPLHGFLALPPLPGGPRQEAGVVALDTDVYVLGGLDETERLLARVEIHDTLTGAWRAGAPLPVPMSHANAVEFGGRLYVLGFLGRRYAPDPRGYVFDPAAGTWSAGPRLPAGRVRGGSGVATRDGRVYVIGGSAVRAVAMCDTLDPVTGEWTTLPDLPEPRDHLAARFVGGELLVAAGTTGVPEGVLATTWALDETAGAWRPRGPLGVARGVAGAAVLDDRLYLFGGEGLGPGAGASGAFDAVEVYDPALDAFTALAPLPAPRRAFGAAEIGGRIYMAGGAASLGIFPVSDFAVWAP